MQGTATYAPKKKSLPVVENLCFSACGAAIEKIFRDYPVGKILFISDSGSLGVFSAAACSPRAVAVVLDGEDVLPLFTMPDGITCVAAAGKRETLLAARGFAAINGLPAVLFPQDASLYGVFERETRLLTGGVRGKVYLEPAWIVCDPVLLRPTLGRTLAGQYLSRLALFETRAITFLTRREATCAYEDAFRTLDCMTSGEEEIVRRSAALRAFEQDGLPCGEGLTLAEVLRLRGVELPQWKAYLLLLSLYTAFLKRGKPRKYRIADYSARFCFAGIGDAGYLAAQIPTVEEYSKRAFALERSRGILLRELNVLNARRMQDLSRIRAYAAAVDIADGYAVLKCLPELKPDGLCALIRDFGLLEEL